MKNNFNQGYILISVLVILLLLSILATSTIDTTLQEVKMSSNQQYSHQLFRLAETGLQYGEAALKNGNTSVEKNDKSTETSITEKDAKWWQQYANSTPIAEGIVQYVIEKIADDNCATIIDGQAKKKGVTYYRISSRAADKQNRYQIILQSSYARAKAGKAQCYEESTDNKPEKKENIIQAGLQSWHQAR